MSIHDSIHKLAVFRPTTTLMMLCGIFGAAAAGAAGAATVQDDVPRLVVRYNVESLATDSGARTLYQRLVSAAAQVCPADFTGSRLPNPAVERCRRQSIARAVQQIGSPRLAAVHASSTKSG